MNIRFEQLSQGRLAEALSLIAMTFPDYLEHVEKIYRVSLENNKEDEHWKTRRILEYWIAIDSDSDTVVALTGFYQLTEHSKDEVWLGWYCASPSVRGRGVGRRTLEWTIGEARSRGYKSDDN